MFLCHKCSAVWTGNEVPTRRDLCEKCHFPLRVCLNCKFYDSARSKQCRLDEAELVQDKEKANFCEYFKFRDGKGEAVDQSSMVKDKWASLFKG